MPYGGYCVEGRGPGEWVVRNGASRVAAIFPTQAEASAYANKVTEMCAPQMEFSEYTKWQKLAQSRR
jgi:Uncharacterized protein conserved in bacteria (DUF2188)